MMVWIETGRTSTLLYLHLRHHQRCGCVTAKISAVITTNTHFYTHAKKCACPIVFFLKQSIHHEKVQTDFDRSSASIINDGEASFEGFASVKIPHDEECKL